MNCAQLRDVLPAFMYGDLPPETELAAEAHLKACPDCRAELAALAEVRRLLDLAPLPRVQVDTSRIYEGANRYRQRQARRWRRVACTALAAAASLLVILGLQLEIRWESHQLVLRWGAPVVADAEPKTKQLLVAERPAAPEIKAADLQLVRDLVHALAASVEERDGKFQNTLARLESQLNQAQDQARTRWVATERYVSALHTSQMDSHAKGEK
jgi:predicted anti-sigma-YlaC factor YlaD